MNSLSCNYNKRIWGGDSLIFCGWGAQILVKCQSLLLWSTTYNKLTAIFFKFCCLYCATIIWCYEYQLQSLFCIDSNSLNNLGIWHQLRGLKSTATPVYTVLLNVLQLWIYYNSIVSSVSSRTQPGSMYNLDLLFCIDCNTTTSSV